MHNRHHYHYGGTREKPHNFPKIFILRDLRLRVSAERPCIRVACLTAFDPPHDYVSTFLQKLCACWMPPGRCLTIKCDEFAVFPSHWVAVINAGIFFSSRICGAAKDERVECRFAWMHSVQMVNALIHGRHNVKIFSVRDACIVVDKWMKRLNWSVC